MVYDVLNKKIDMLLWIIGIQNQVNMSKLKKDVFMKKYYMQSEFKYLVWLLSGNGCVNGY